MVVMDMGEVNRGRGHTRIWLCRGGPIYFTPPSPPPSPSLLYCPLPSLLLPPLPSFLPSPFSPSPPHPTARQQCYNVVLVDTAGRMQDNEPLMRALAKLIRVNNPDLVLFVGEALVGNEAVDQLEKFNRALVDHSEEGSTRTIDGILLTKFDTIDDKVG